MTMSGREFQMPKNVLLVIMTLGWNPGDWSQCFSVVSEIKYIYIAPRGVYSKCYIGVNSYYHLIFFVDNHGFMNS